MPVAVTLRRDGIDGYLLLGYVPLVKPAFDSVITLDEVAVCGVIESEVDTGTAPSRDAPVVSDVMVAHILFIGYI